MQNKSFSQMLGGMFLIAVGSALLLHVLDIVDFSSVVAYWWPLLIMGIGLIALAGNPRRWVWPGIVIAFGGLLLLRQLGVIGFNVWTLIGPAIIIAFGLSLIFKRPSWGAPKAATVDRLQVAALFSGCKQIGSTSFKGGEVTAMFGGAEIDLRDAKIAKTAHIDIFVALGGVELQVPADWRVQVNGTPILGGWEDKTKAPAGKDAPVLTVSGTCILGGITITN